LGLLSDTAATGGEQTAPGETYGHLLLLGPAAPGYLDEPTLMPGALVEPLFITNPADATLAASPVGQQALAQAIARGIDQFLQQQ
jgi:N-acetylmuramoyl-L-alanine amidase